MNKPKLSVCLITYRHEAFIVQALEGIFKQIVNFEVEIVIGEDKSPDRTLALIEEHIPNSPFKVKLLENKTNLGMIGNWLNTMANCEGEYIALIEGDDYWTDVHKLQKQVELLDSQPKLSFCFHGCPMQFEREDNQEQYFHKPPQEGIYHLKDVLHKTSFVPTCSVVLRRAMLSTFPEQIKSLKMIDKFLFLSLADKGDLYYIAQDMGVYRIHNGGISQTQWLGNANRFQEDSIALLKLFNTFTKHRHDEAVNFEIVKTYELLIKNNQHDAVFYKKQLKALFRYRPFKNRGVLKNYIITDILPKPIYRAYSKFKKGLRRR